MKTSDTVNNKDLTNQNVNYVLKYSIDNTLHNDIEKPDNTRNICDGSISVRACLGGDQDAASPILGSVTLHVENNGRSQ